MNDNSAKRREIGLYIKNAREMLSVAQLNLENGFHTSAINRAYYAIFYAAAAVLVTQSQVRGKHSGVISAFRERFVKSGLFNTEYSDIYGRIMDHRNAGDYELDVSLGEEKAEADFQDAARFVKQVEAWLKQESWL